MNTNSSDKEGTKPEYVFLEDGDLENDLFKEFTNSEEYRKFKHTKEGEDLYAKQMDKIRYYKSCYDLKILCAKVNGKIVGQSCALKAYAMAKGVREEWWWSVDTFLMTACRGLGIGKNLQKILHVSLPNFSSAWYTPINGAVKKKCGAHGIGNIEFAYYPVSTSLSIFGDLGFRKLFKRPIPFRISIPYLYSALNGLFINTKLKGYTITEIPYDKMGEDVSEFMETALSKKDFHIERSLHFLKWRYSLLPAGYTMLKIEKDGKTDAIVAFSDVYQSRFDESPIKGVTIYDMVIAPESKLTKRQVLCYIANWFKRLHKKMDGFQMLDNFRYFGRWTYPFKACPVLTTLPGEYPDLYLTYADQDLYQI